MFLRRTVQIFLKQLQSILLGNSRLLNIRFEEKSIDKNKIQFALHKQINTKLIEQKARGLAKLRFKGRKIASIKVEESQVTLQFVPEKTQED